MRPRGAFAISVLLHLACTLPAHAEGEARCPTPKSAKERDRVSVELFDRAIAKEAADPDAALELLRCADTLADRPAIALRRGLIAERIGKNDEAITSLERYLALAGDYAPDKAEMQRHIARLKSALASPEDPAPEPAPDRPPSPEPDRSRPSSRKTTAGIVTLGVSGALLVTGGVLLYSAKKKSDAVHDVDPSSRTPWQSADGEERLDAAKSQQTWGFIALGVGVLGAAAGAYLVVDASPRSAFVGIRRAF
jgi:hypothetical protein